MRHAAARIRALAASALALALAFSGCDTASPEPSADARADAEAAALSIAQAVATESGGLLEDASDALRLAGAPASLNPPGRAGCTGTRTYDAEDGRWTSTFSCERGNPDGRVYAAFGRTTTHQFLGADGQPQPEPRGATRLNYTISDATGVRRVPGFSHTLLELGADFAVTDFEQRLATINGTYVRAATDTVAAPGVTRTLAARVAMQLQDVRAPRSLEPSWERAVSGTITGHYRATMTMTTRAGQTRTQEIDRPFTITFGDEGGARVALIALGRHRFAADLRSGVLVGR
ncbi:MAG: hypothetical protein ACK41D_03870 [Rubricoccaceae bacterium]